MTEGSGCVDKDGNNKGDGLITANDFYGPFNMVLCKYTGL